MGNNCCGPRDRGEQKQDAQESVTLPDYTKVISEVREVEQDLTILVLGLDNAGKTSILRSFSRESLGSIKPTTGFQIKTQKYDSSTLNLKEVGGAAAIRPYWTHYIDNAQGLIWVVDSSDRKRINDSKSELHKLLISPKLSDCPLLVLANKSDAGGMSVAEMSAFLALNKIQGRQWAIEGCSAISGKGIPVGVDYITYIGYIKDKVPVPPGVNPFRD